MRKLTLFLFLIAIFACNSPQEDPSNVAKAVTTSQTIKIDPTPTDTVKPKPKKKKNPYVVYDTSRKPSEMITAFPYDIDLKDAKGNIHKSNDILKPNGKPTVVLFWLTTCFPCLIEMKAIQNEIDTWKKETDFNLVAISTDFEKNYGNFVKRVEDSNWSWESYVDVNREFRKVMPGELNGLPQSFIFDKDGNIVYHSRKYATGDEHKLYAKIKETASK